MTDRGDPWVAVADLLDAQIWAADNRARDAQIAEQVAADRATWTLVDRIRASRRGRPIRAHLAGGHIVGGVIETVGDAWLFLTLPTGAVHALVQLDAITLVSGLTDASRSGPIDPLARPGIQVRAWLDQGAGVTLLLRHGQTLTTHVQHVQSDHLDVASPEGAVIPLASVAAIVAR